MVGHQQIGKMSSCESLALSQITLKILFLDFAKMKIRFFCERDIWSVIYQDDHTKIEYCFPNFDRATQFALEISKQLGLPY